MNSDEKKPTCKDCDWIRFGGECYINIGCIHPDDEACELFKPTDEYLQRKALTP